MFRGFFFMSLATYYYCIDSSAHHIFPGSGCSFRALTFAFVSINYKWKTGPRMSCQSFNRVWRTEHVIL